MSTLFTYCIPYDDGAAPNPFWDICTLVICKPKIRRIAINGDWIVGTGSIDSPIGDISGKVVYAMRVSQTMTMKEYDRFTLRDLANKSSPQQAAGYLSCQRTLASRFIDSGFRRNYDASVGVLNPTENKIPDWHSLDVRRRLGDSIYDFSTDPPGIRPGVHDEGNRSRDLSGERALLSDHFYYFGDSPVDLPDALRPIVNQGRGHRSVSNGQYFERFVDWIHSLGYRAKVLRGKPQLDLFSNEALRNSCANARCAEADEDEKSPDDC